ncbi:transporter substrate-binding domain-containing protein [Kiritimatiellota bacterium B12222]|nr:transporter substrate-binding domain-containing protein [Kiritimatiellota bacterium B12222]
MNTFTRLLTYTLISLSAYLQAAAPLFLASDPWPPFTGNVGAPRVIIDLVEEALRRGDIEASTTIVEMSALNSGLASGQFQGSPALWKTDERNEILLFSNPILENKLVLLGRKGSDVSASSLLELKGKRVGIVDGYGYLAELRDTGPAFITGKNNQANFSALLAGKLDYMLVDELLLHYAMQNQLEKFKKTLVFGTQPIITKPLYFALRKDTPNAAEIIETFNRELATMLQDGSYQTILQLPWIRIDIDGDGKFELIYNGDQALSEVPLSHYQPFYHADEIEEEEERLYRVKGQLYDSWDDIPKSLKEPVDSSAGGVLYEFKF